MSAEHESDAEQAAVLEAIRQWYHGGSSQALTVGGYAGTGKTTGIIARLPQVLPGTDIAYCAPTGKAALVLQGKLGQEVSTIHGLIYLTVTWHLCGCGQCGSYGCMVTPGDCPQPLTNIRGFPLTKRTYRLREGGLDADLIVVDEASMVGRTEWTDLCSMGCRIIAVGDHGQLMPVKSDFSLMRSPDLKLEIVRRQVQGDPIVAMATWARTAGHIPHGYYGPLARKLTPEQATGNPLALWLPGTLMITARRATRARMNEWVREGWRPGVTDLVVPGDQLVCLQNDNKLDVRNGQIFTVTWAEQDSDDVIEFSDTDGRELRAAVKQFSTDEPLERGEIPRDCGLFGYGYALTCHKAQGSEADRVVVVEEDWPRKADDRRRWLYTACTRAKTELTVIGR